MLRYRFQLQDGSLGAFAGPSITTAGGKATVTAAGSQARATLYNKDGSALANPISLTRGAGEFYTANTVTAVDLFILTGGAYSVNLWNVGPDALHEVPVDRSARTQCLVIPFSIADQLANATERDTGIDLIAGMVMQPFPYVKVVTIDSGISIDVGTGEAVPAEGGDDNGFISAISLTSAALVGDTGSALLNAVEYIAPAISLTWKLSTGADTGTGYIFLPYRVLTTGAPTIT
jgi:hypothetical protein